MRASSAVVDVILGSIAGLFIYVAVQRVLPSAAGPVTLVLLLISSILLTALRRRDGSLTQLRLLRADDDRLLRGQQWTLHRVATLDVAKISVPLVVAKAVLAFAIGGLILAVLVPLAYREGFADVSWLPPTVLILCVAAGVGPDLWRWMRRKG